MMHILVEGVDAWWNHVQASGVVERYGVRCCAVEAQPWHMRVFCLHGPSGVLWRIGQKTDLVFWALHPLCGCSWPCPESPSRACDALLRNKAFAPWTSTFPVRMLSQGRSRGSLASFQDCWQGVL